MNNLDQMFLRGFQVAVVHLRANDKEDSFNDEDDRFLLPSDLPSKASLCQLDDSHRTGVICLAAICLAFVNLVTISDVVVVHLLSPFVLDAVIFFLDNYFTYFAASYCSPSDVNATLDGKLGCF